MSIEIGVQRAVTVPRDVTIPTDNQIQGWAEQAVTAVAQSSNDNWQMSVRIVDVAEITQLNRTYRHKDKATNVLSFAFELPPGLPPEAMEAELGDVIVCAEVVADEAGQQNKTVEAHWAHMIIHGTLHLLGFDHEDNDEAEVMEAQERLLMKALGYADPYAADARD